MATLKFQVRRILDETGERRRLRRVRRVAGVQSAHSAAGYGGRQSRTTNQGYARLRGLGEGGGGDFLQLSQQGLSRWNLLLTFGAMRREARKKRRAALD
jgi:hypothetical protein